MKIILSDKIAVEVGDGFSSCNFDQTAGNFGAPIMFSPANPAQVYIATGVTDMRKSINGLSILVADQLELDPSIRPSLCFLQSEARYHQDFILG